MKAKSIGYAYPSSITATKAGYAKSGCWYIEMYPEVTSTIGGKKMGYYPSKASAVTAADALPEPYTNMYLRYFN